MTASRLMILCCAAIAVATSSTHGTPWTWTTISYPGADSTMVYGISGNRIVGTCEGLGAPAAFLLDGSVGTRFAYPGAPETLPFGIAGDNIVGWAHDSVTSDFHGFCYNAANEVWTRLEYPGFEAFPNAAYGIEGNKIVGYYTGLNANEYGYLYDGSTWTSLNYPKSGVFTTKANGISGNNIVGEYGGYGVNGIHSFIYNGSTWTSLMYPGAGNTSAKGISGDIVVGQFNDNTGHHGFLYNIKTQTWTSFDYPGPFHFSTYPQGISGNNIVGSYVDGFGRHSFLLTIPEPATFLLLGLGGATLLRRCPGFSRHRTG